MLTRHLSEAGLIRRSPVSSTGGDEGRWPACLTATSMSRPDPVEQIDRHRRLPTMLLEKHAIPAEPARPALAGITTLIGILLLVGAGTRLVLCLGGGLTTHGEESFVRAMIFLVVGAILSAFGAIALTRSPAGWWIGRVMLGLGGIGTLSGARLLYGPASIGQASGGAAMLAAAILLGGGTVAVTLARRE